MVSEDFYGKVNGILVVNEYAHDNCNRLMNETTNIYPFNNPNDAVRKSEQILKWFLDDRKDDKGFEWIGQPENEWSIYSDSPDGTCRLLRAKGVVRMGTMLFFNEDGAEIKKDEPKVKEKEDKQKPGLMDKIFGSKEKEEGK